MEWCSINAIRKTWQAPRPGCPQVHVMSSSDRTQNAELGVKTEHIMKDVQPRNPSMLAWKMPVGRKHLHTVDPKLNPPPPCHPGSLDICLTVSDKGLLPPQGPVGAGCLQLFSYGSLAAEYMFCISQFRA